MRVNAEATSTCLIAKPGDYAGRLIRFEARLVDWREHQPDVTLLDLSLTGMDCLETLRRMLEEFSRAHVLMLTSSEAQQDVRHALRIGARGYLTKNARGPELVTAIREVHAGGQHLGETIARRLGEEEDRGQLSRREIEVLGLVRQGCANAEIGRRLGIAERTVRSHMELIMGKLDASDRAAAVVVRAGASGEWDSSQLDSLLGLTPAAFTSGSRLGIDVTTGNTFSYANDLGALIFSGSASTLDFGSGTTNGNTFSFTGLSLGTLSALNARTATLNIWNWSGTPYEPGEPDPGTDLTQVRLLFGGGERLEIHRVRSAQVLLRRRHRLPRHGQ